MLQKVLDILGNVNRLARKLVLRTNLSEIQEIFRRTNNIGYRSFELKIRCANIANSSIELSKNASQSKKWASEAKADQTRQANDLKEISDQLQNIQELNSTQIDELRQLIDESRMEFEQMRLTNVLTVLRDHRRAQEKQIISQRKELASLREEVKEMKKLYEGMKSTQGCGLD